METSIHRTWIRNTLFVLFQPFLPPTGFFPMFIHEGAHWISALIIGVPISEIDFGWYGLGPGVAIPLSTPTKFLPFFFYSGGMTSAIMILFLYIFYWMRLSYHTPSLTHGVMGFIILFSFVLQLYIGLIEGRYYQDYPNHIYNSQLVLLTLVAIIFHTLIFFSLRYHSKRSI